MKKTIIAILTIALGIGSAQSASAPPSLPSVLKELDTLSHKRVPVIERVDSMNAVYDAKLATLKTPLANLTDSDIRALQGAYDLLAAYTTLAAYDRNEVYVAALESTMSELRRRSLATPQDYANTIGALISRREFSKARELNALAPPGVRIMLPYIKKEAGFEEGKPAELSLSPTGSELSLRNVDLQLKSRIVIVAGCHFGRDAAEAIYANPLLKDAFVSGRAVWLEQGGRELNLADIQEWNGRFAEFPMSIAYKNRDWNGIDFSRIPTFYFYRNGTLVASVQGWSPTDTPALLKDALRKVDLLPLPKGLAQEQ